MDTEQMTDDTSKQPPAEVDTTIESLEADFSPEEQQVLASLRTRYQQCLDLFSAKEMARLRFMRWLYQQGYFPSSRDARAVRNRSSRASRLRKASAQPNA